MNAKQKKLLSRSPEMVKNILKCLPEGWAVESVHAISMGWIAKLTFKNMRFGLTEDRLNLEISSMKGGQWQEIHAPGIASPKQLAELLQKEAEEMLKNDNL